MNAIKFFSIVIFSMICSGVIQGQEKVLKPALLVAEAKRTAPFETFNIFNKDEGRSSVNLPEVLKDYTLLDLDKNMLRAFLNDTERNIIMQIPQEGRSSLDLLLVETDIFTEDFSVKTAPSMTQVKIEKGRHFRGIVNDDPTSVVALSIFNDRVMGLIASDKYNANLVLGKLENSDTYILYTDHQIRRDFNFNCATPDALQGYSREDIMHSESGERALTDCIRLYLEVDYDIYQSKGSNTSNVSAFVTGIFNQVSMLYANEQINTLVSEIVIWNQPSPYNSTSSIGMLNAFTAYRQGFNGNLAQLLSYKASGGVAYLDGLCRSNPDFSMSYAGIQATFQNVPTYSWTVEVCTHEFGHLFGSEHTHACVWNGNNTAIDGCYTTEGNCPNPGLPQGGGTIMSYCHLTGAGINFNNGFGLQPGNVIRNRVTNAGCLQTCSGNPPPPPPPSCTQNQLVLTIRTDNYPSETTWNIKNAAGSTLYSGGPYSQSNTIITVNLCLPAGCFNFNILDSYGDGICCSYGNGYYNVKQGTSTLISGGQFTFSESKSFCAGQTATCSDGIQNQGETGIDCGGPNCPACPSCSDGIQNQGETGVDCGGPNCPACPSCSDGIQNQGETGVDCGGPNCPACSSCSDGIQNGSETGVDCGGTSCPPCNTSPVTITNLAGHYFETGWDGWTSGGYDCSRVQTTSSPEGSFSIRIRDDEGELSSFTSQVFNLSTFDSVTLEFKFRAVSMESGEDFWLRYFNGSSWTTLKSYVSGTDFNNNVVYTQKLKISGNLPATARFRFQNDASANDDQVFIDAVIIKGYKGMASCTDGLRNGSETGVDCGGPDCPACPTCNDGIQNQGETAVDCGGPNCAACPTCNDGVKNGSETGIDCGGTTCPPCNSGGSTVLLSGHYFETGWDGWADGGIDCYRYYGSNSPEGNYSIRLRDDSGEESSMTSPLYNLSTFSSVQIQFKFRAVSMEAGEDFFLRYFNGTVWQTVASFVSGTTFSNNVTYSVTINLNGNLSSSARFRFQCDAGDDTDVVYIDAVEIRGTTGGSIFQNHVLIEPIEHNVPNKNADRLAVEIYPNPASNTLTVAGSEILHQIQIFNPSGILIMTHKPDEKKTEMDISGLTNGLYLIRLIGPETNETHKFVKI